MIFADTHTHLYLPAFDKDREAMVGRARAAGVETLLLPNIDVESIGPMMEMVDQYQGVCFPMAGLHPTSVKEDWEDQLQTVRLLAENGGMAGIGECGIDLYWDKTHYAAQREVFITQLHWSLELGLPVAIHIRDSFPEVFEALATFGKTTFRGVFHCFTGSSEEAGKAIGYGFHLGIGGKVTFRNSKLQLLLKDIPPERVVLETDAPFMAPEPFRGRRNEPAYLGYVAEKLSEIWGMPIGKVAEVTTGNALRLFNTVQK